MGPSEVSPLRSPAGTSLAVAHCASHKSTSHEGRLNVRLNSRWGSRFHRRINGDVVSTVSPHGHDNGSFVFYEGSHERVYESVHLL